MHSYHALTHVCVGSCMFVMSPPAHNTPVHCRHPVNAVRCWMCCVVLGLVVVAVVSLMMCFGTLAHMCTAGTQ